MFLFLFIQLLLSLSFFVRIARSLYFERIFTSRFVTKIGTLFFIFEVSLLIFSNENLFLLIFSFYSPVVALYLLKKRVIYRREQLFQKDFLNLLNNVLLQMRLGNGFRTAVQSCCCHQNQYFRDKMTKIMEVVAFSTQLDTLEKSFFIRKIVQQFRKIDKQPHMATERLKEFRNLLKAEQDFRHRSVQVCRQVHVQQIVLCFLYVALLFFVIWAFGWNEVVQSVLGSLFLFVFGAWFHLFWGKRLKWNI